MGLISPSEEMLVGAFVKGLRANLFSESLIRSPAMTLVEVRSRAIVHIETKEAMQKKRVKEKRLSLECKNKDSCRQVMETFSPHKRSSVKFSPYSTQRTAHRKMVRTTCPALTKPKAQLIKVEDIAKYLRFPLETGRLLGKDTSAWCEFHKTHGHDTESCLGQLASLPRRGILLKYVSSEDREDMDEIPILGDFNTIAGGFAGGGPTKFARKRYA